MAKRRQASSLILAADTPVPYRLEFQASEDGSRVSRHAKLTSSLLDLAMYGRRGLEVHFMSIEKRQPGTPVTLDPFEMASLAAFLEQQAEVRRQLEHELLEYAGADVEIRTGAEIWKRTKVEGVVFAPRTVAGVDQVAFVRKKYKRQAKKILEVEYDAPDARSSFDVAMMPEWAGHLLTAVYRDGRLVDLRVEG